MWFSFGFRLIINFCFCDINLDPSRKRNVILGETSEEDLSYSKLIDQQHYIDIHKWKMSHLSDSIS